DRSVVGFSIVERLRPPFVSRIASHVLAGFRDCRWRQRLGLLPISKIFGIGHMCSSGELFSFCGIDRNQSSRHFAKPLSLGQYSFRVPQPSLKASPLPPDSSDSVILRVLCAVEGTGPFDVEQNCLLPQARVFEAGDEVLKALSPLREVFVGPELYETRTCTTGVAGCAAGFDFERIRHRRTVREQPVTSSLVYEVDEHKVEVSCMLDDSLDASTSEIACDHPLLER